MTLDAGGTNFVFSAMQEGKEIVEPIRMPSSAHDLARCLETIVDGFTRVRECLPAAPVAISFAFPGPADYPAGIIGDLANLPAFRGGVALGPMLEDAFGLPVFINNDGDLFTLGEAIGGYLPWINRRLEEAGSPKRYKNLFGITLGTGFGGGLARDGQLYLGDNSAACEIWIMRNKLFPQSFAEEGASIRAVQRVYNDAADCREALSPRDIYEIAEGNKPGNREAAIRAFRHLGETVGDALANTMTLLDGLVVIGGGLAGAARLLLPAVVAEMNGSLQTLAGDAVRRMVARVYNTEDENDLRKFLEGGRKEVTVPGSGRKVLYDPEQRIGIGLSRLGTSEAVALGAYAYALENIPGREGGRTGVFR
ncbi:ROK family protein [bacterium]|nr:ROK family protein [bacterium]